MTWNNNTFLFICVLILILVFGEYIVYYCTKFYNLFQKGEHKINIDEEPDFYEREVIKECIKK